MPQPAKPTTSPPSDPRTRHIWIGAALRQAGTSFSAIARELGVSPQAVQHSTRVSNRRAQEAIAAKLGMPPQQLFPEWYRADGTRLGDPLYGEDNTEANMSDNVKTGREART